MEKTHKLFKSRVIFNSKVEPINSKCVSCDFIARDKADLKSIKDEKVCTECLINFKHAMKEEWELGIRPTTKVARDRMNIFIQEV